jgi:probable HAF family extracellular repeat protein
MKDLGTFAGKFSTLWGFAINDSGVAVGQSTFQDTYHAFVYRSGTIKDLNTLIPPGSGWELNEAEGINSAGQIVGLGMHKRAAACVSTHSAVKGWASWFALPPACCVVQDVSCGNA